MLYVRLKRLIKSGQNVIKYEENNKNKFEEKISTF